MITLHAIQKNKTNEVLRSEGFIPAVVYGNGSVSIAIAVSEIDFLKAYRDLGETGTLTLKTESESYAVMVKEVQKEPVRGIPIHIDFLIIDLKKPVEIAVPLVFIGTAEAEKSGKGVLVKTLHEVLVRALPQAVPHSIEVDVSSLDSIDSVILAESLLLPQGVERITDGADVVAAITAFSEEKETDGVVDLSAIEVERKGKKEDEENSN